MYLWICPEFVFRGISEGIYTGIPGAVLGDVNIPRDSCAMPNYK